MQREERLKKLRQLMRESDEARVAELARYCGVSASAIYKWRKGESDPLPENERKLCSFFNLSATGEQKKESHKVIDLAIVKAELRSLHETVGRLQRYVEELSA